MAFDTRTNKNLWHMTEGFRGLYLGATLAMILSVALMFASTLFGMYALDVVESGDLGDGVGLIAAMSETTFADPLIAYLTLTALAAVLVTGLGGGFMYLRNRWAAMASEGIMKRTRDALYDRLHRLPATFFDSSDTGDLVQRCSSDVETVRVFLAQHIVEISRAIVMVGTMLPILFWRDPTLAWLSICLMPLISISAYFFFSKVKEHFQRADESEAAMTAVLQENLTGIRVVRAFAQQGFEMDRFGGANRTFRDHLQRLNRLMGWYWGASDLLSMSQMTIVLVAGGAALARGEITAGELFVFMTMVGMAIWPVRHLGRVLTDSGKAVVSLGRINHILDNTPETSDPAPETGRVEGRIEFHDVTFAYGDDQAVLEDINLEIPAGQTVGIVGAPGSGKSTLIRLLLRFYEHQHGTIRIDGHDIATVSRQWLRHQIGVSLQDPFLYSRTIEANLLVARQEAPREEILEATKDAAIDTSIASFPGGFDEMVGERGVTLSGGQRQRLALARALLKDPPILILDDSLSAVDTGTEQDILEALSRRHGRHTTLVIAHRLSSIRDADRILVFDHGRIVQDGTHEDLKDVLGPYRRLCEIQGALDASIERDLRETSNG